MQTIHSSHAQRRGVAVASLLIVLIVIVAAIPPGAAGQEVAVTTREERCRHNQARMAEIDQQVQDRVTRIDFYRSSNTGVRTEDEAREDLRLIRKALAEPEGTEVGNVKANKRALAARYSLPWIAAYDTDFRLYLTDLRNEVIFNIKLVKENNERISKLSDEVTRLGSEYRVYADRLRELKCDEIKDDATSNASGETACNGFAGTWETSFGEMTFSFDGNRVTASYAFDSGRVEGTVNGNVMDGTYIENQARGTFRFTLSQDGQRFGGTWQRTSGTTEPPTGEWEGKCKGGK